MSAVTGDTVADEQIKELIASLNNELAIAYGAPKIRSEPLRSQLRTSVANIINARASKVSP